jgi:hypothetical protein
MRRLKYCTRGLKGRAAKKIWTDTAAERREKPGLFGEGRVNKERIKIPPGIFSENRAGTVSGGGIVCLSVKESRECRKSLNLQFIKEGRSLKECFSDSVFVGFRELCKQLRQKVQVRRAANHADSESGLISEAADKQVPNGFFCFAERVHRDGVGMHPVVKPR